MKKLASIFIIAFMLFSCSNDESPSVNYNPVLELTKTIGGSKNELANSVAKTQDGGYAVLGYTQSNDGDIVDKLGDSYDYWVMKFDANDELVWNKTYGGTLDDRGNSIIQTQDGGYAIIGYSQSNDEDVSQNSGSYDFWVVKLTSSGEISWEKSLGYSGSDRGLTIIQTSDNGYFLTGVLDVTASGGAGNSLNAFHAGGDYWAIKLGATGNTEWTKYFGGGLNDTPYDAIETPDNGFIIVGTSDSNDVDITNNKGSYDFWVVKVNATGALVWEKSFGGSEIDEAHSIVATNDGNYLILGNTRSDDLDVTEYYGAADLWLIKISPSGNLIWQKSFGGSSFDVGRSVHKAQGNTFLIAGSSRSQDGDLIINNGQNDAWFIRVNKNGEILGQKTIGGSGIDFAYGITELNNGKIIMVGESGSNDADITENKGFTDLLIIKLK